MRAIYLKELQKDDESLSLSKDESHHLINVVRAKDGELVLALNGEGLVGQGPLLMGKKTCEFQMEKWEELPGLSEWNLCVAVVKKEQWKLILKIAVELGFKKIQPLITEFVDAHALPHDKEQMILVEALKQSNNPWLPKLEVPMKLAQYLEESEIDKKAPNVVLSQGLETQSDFSLAEALNIFIGPEGGFSLDEIDVFKKKNFSFLGLPSAILRTSTCVPAAWGALTR